MEYNIEYIRTHKLNQIKILRLSKKLIEFDQKISPDKYIYDLFITCDGTILIFISACIIYIFDLIISKIRYEISVGQYKECHIIKIINNKTDRDHEYLLHIDSRDNAKVYNIYNGKLIGNFSFDFAKMGIFKTKINIEDRFEIQYIDQQNKQFCHNIDENFLSRKYIRNQNIFRNEKLPPIKISLKLMMDSGNNSYYELYSRPLLRSICILLNKKDSLIFNIDILTEIMKYILPLYSREKIYNLIKFYLTIE